MTNFLRKAPVLMVSMVALGSGLICSNTPSDFKTSVKTLVPVRDTLLGSWMNKQDMLAHRSFLSFDPSLHGNFPFLFSRFVSAESASPVDPKKEASFGVEDGIKPCGGCLGRNSIPNAAARVGPAVVNLSVPPGYYGPDVNISLGSGTIIDENGTILTSSHVLGTYKSLIPSSNGEVKVTLQDGRTFKGTFVNAHIRSDIGIVKINSKSPLPSAKLGSSKKLRPGECVVAVGCPLPFQSSVTAGIVSCVDCQGSDLASGGMIREYLQTNFPVDAGSCGGPLVNIDGEVIGVSMAVGENVGFGYSVPIDAISKSLEHFKTKGRVVLPWTGLEMLDLNDMIVATIKDRDPSFPSVSEGVLVFLVVPGSPADRSGFRPADVVVEFDGFPVNSVNEIRDILSDKAGKPIEVRVERSNNVSVTLTVTPEEASDL